MKILITGICGFVGHALAARIKSGKPAADIFGIDNLMRAGSEANRRLARDGIRVLHGDIRCASDVDALGPADWVIDAAANPSASAGFDSRSSTRQLVEHNLFGTVNLLEYCRRHGAGFILLSTSRVYAIRPLSRLPMIEAGRRFAPRFPDIQCAGFSKAGIAEDFSTDPPVSLYGATKLASETLALEYGAACGFPVWINRCGVLAGAGQFGRRSRVSFRTGCTPGALDGLYATSALAAKGCKSAMPCIRMIWLLWCSSKWTIQGQTVRRFATWPAGPPIPCRCSN